MSDPQVEEKYFEGVSASPGIAIGPALCMIGIIHIPEKQIKESEVKHEIKRFNTAIRETKKELKLLRENVQDKLSDSDASIFEVHDLILEDDALYEQVVSKLKSEKKNIEYIFYSTMNEYRDMLEEVDDPYLSDRSIDIIDVKRRVLRKLYGKVHHQKISEPSIIVVDNLMPTDTVYFERDKILGFAADFGGRMSHATILARSLGLPAVVGLNNLLMNTKSGDRLILDGLEGKVILNPTKETIKSFHRSQKKFDDFERGLLGDKEKPAISLDGHEVKLMANIGLSNEVDSVLKHGANGIGLFRTEYLLLTKQHIPTEEEQFKEYQTASKRMYPYPVSIRTFDLGGDKTLDSLDLPEEVNPFLGWRAIRISLDNPDLFKDQLRAILRANVRKNLRILFPMISSLDELRKVKSMLQEVKDDLKKNDISFDDNIPVGIMIEVPAAVIMADELAKEVDFFSIGTNDLTQFILAVNRGNDKVSFLYKTFHPAVLRMIKQTIDIAHQNGIWINMCGEMAGDPLATLLLFGMGLDEFSASSIVLPEVKKLIRTTTYKEAKEVARKALGYVTESEVERYLKKVTAEKFPDLMI